MHWIWGNRDRWPAQCSMLIFYEVDLKNDYIIVLMLVATCTFTTEEGIAAIYLVQLYSHKLLAYSLLNRFHRSSPLPLG